MALGDSLGPWLVAARGPWSTAPHAPPYGWMLAVPHAVLLPTSADLYSAFAAIRVVDALVAPLGAWGAFRLTRNPWGALAVGLVLALDPSLIDTATSGAEAYQAPVAIAALTLFTTARGRWHTSLLTALAFSWAVMCHPLSILAAPILLLHRRRCGVLLATALLLGPHLWRLATHAGDALAPEPRFPWLGLQAWASQSGTTAILFGLGLAAGLVHRRVRPTSAAALAALGLMIATGARIGYLRDHHLRILSAPVAVGLAALPGPLGLLAAAPLLRWPAPDEGRARNRRPGTLGLLHRTTTTVLSRRDPSHPLVVDGFRTTRVPAVEPGGVWLDLSLRGVPRTELDRTTDCQIALLLTAPRDATEHEAPAAFGLVPVEHWDTWSIWMGSPEALHAWSTSDCADRTATRARLPRVGGAWDGLALFHPERGAASVDDWWACRHR